MQEFTITIKHHSSFYFFREQKHLGELIFCAAQQELHQYLAPTLLQNRRDEVIQHGAKPVLMKDAASLRHTVNLCTEEVFCLGPLAPAIIIPLHTSKSETRPRRTRYRNSCDTKVLQTTSIFYAVSFLCNRVW